MDKTLEQKKKRYEELLDILKERLKPVTEELAQLEGEINDFDYSYAQHLKRGIDLHQP